MQALKYVVLSLAIRMYLLVILFQEKKVWFTSAAAVIVIILGIIFPGQIFTGESTRIYAFTHSVFEIINWNVIMIYLGSMTIAALFLYSNVPARIADGIIQ